MNYVHISKNNEPVAVRLSVESRICLNKTENNLTRDIHLKFNFYKVKNSITTLLLTFTFIPLAQAAL